MITALPTNHVSSSNPTADMTLVDDNTAVPGTATFVGGKAFTPAGSAYVCPYPAGGLAPQGVTFIGGRAVRIDGAQIVTTGGATAAVLHGVAVTSTGELRVSSVATADTYNNGVAATAAGIVCEVGV